MANLIVEKETFIQACIDTARNVMASPNRTYCGWSKSNMILRLQEKVDGGELTVTEVTPILDILQPPHIIA